MIATVTAFSLNTSLESLAIIGQMFLVLFGKLRQRLRTRHK